MMNKTWLAYANRSLCHHAEALNDLGFINWTMHRTNFSIGDIVYLFVSDERRVRFKTQVVEEGCKRQDNAYWPPKKASNHLTYKLELVEEYNGRELDEELLKEHGFRGGRSIEHPMNNNPLLFKYIESIFAKKRDLVLAALNLSPSKIDITASEKAIRSGKFYALGC